MRGNWKKVINLTDKSLQINPHQVKGLKIKAQALRNLQNYRMSMEVLSQAIALDPLNVDLREEKVILMKNLELPPEEIQNYIVETQEIRLSPEYKSWFHSEDGMESARFGMNKSAVYSYTKSIKYNKENPYPYAGRALAYTYSGDFQKAKKDAETALELFRLENHIGAQIYLRKLIDTLDTKIDEALLN